MIQPLDTYVLIEPKPEEEAGIIIPDDVDTEQKNEGKVLAIGPEVKRVSVGDMVLFKPYAFEEHEKNFIGKEEGIIAKL